MPVTYTFASASAPIPLSNLDSNFATPITLGNTAIQLGNTVTTLNNMTFANATVSSGNVTATTVTSTTVTSPAATALTIQSAGTTAMTIDTSQNVGIGTSSPSYRLDLFGTNCTLQVRDNGQTNGLILKQNNADGGNLIYATNNNYLALGTNNTERARIDSSGNLLVGVTSTFSTVGVTTTNTFSSNTATTWAGAFQNKNATTPCGVLVRYDSDPNGTGSSFVYCQGNATLRAEIRSNGGLANYSANNVNLSDERTKTDIQDAGSYLSKICAIPVRTFKYKDQTDDLLNLGVIAQEVEKVAPELVDTSGFGETPEDGIPLKAIYQTDLQYALMKCIQEQQALITQLTERISALEGKA